MRDGKKTSPRTAWLLAAGLPRMAQKLAEETTEVVIDAVRGERAAVIHESVDLLYNLVCCGANSGSQSQRSGPKWIAARRCLGWPRSCRKKSG